MKNAPAPEGATSKTPFERFTELGERLMRVPRDEVAALEKKWQSRKRRAKKNPRANHR